MGAMAAGAPSLSRAMPVSASLGPMTSKAAGVAPYIAMGGMGDAPTTAPAGESAPSVAGRRLAMDTRGSDPRGADTRGSDPVGEPFRKI